MGKKLLYFLRTGTKKFLYFIGIGVFVLNRAKIGTFILIGSINIVKTLHSIIFA